MEDNLRPSGKSIVIVFEPFDTLSSTVNSDIDLNVRDFFPVKYAPESGLLASTVILDNVISSSEDSPRANTAPYCLKLNDDTPFDTALYATELIKFGFLPLT